MVVTDKAGITSIAAALPAGFGSILFWVRLFGGAQESEGA